MFATDSKDDLKNIAEYAPGSRIYVRILVENSESYPADCGHSVCSKLPLIGKWSII